MRISFRPKASGARVIKNWKPPASVKEWKFPKMDYTALTEREKDMVNQLGRAMQIIAEQDKEIARLRKED